MGRGDAAAGIGGIVAGVLGVSVIITLVTGTVIHWPFIAGGILVGLMAAQSVR